jgi:2-amino-4-hydroxy-6-hydroxymethyldihydropteridine diphosphokinase
MIRPVFLGLGSNLAVPVEQLRQACEWLQKHPQITLCQQSAIYQSPAMLLPESLTAQLAEPTAEAVSDYLNMVVEIETSLSAESLLDAIKQQEQLQGRDLGARRWSSRPLDIDILLYGQQCIRTERLTVPHIGIAERDFVLLPWRDISPNTVIPELGTVADCASALGETSAVKVADSLSDITPN